VKKLVQSLPFKCDLQRYNAQREQFKRYGIWADWEDPYLTLLPEYEVGLCTLNQIKLTHNP
jgi:isoleucyl-tRNA synthetase